MLYAAALVVEGRPDAGQHDRPDGGSGGRPTSPRPRPPANFPQYRNFDPYSGHSWASGTSPFADGNNQESTSEAVNAWNGVALWEQVRGRSTAYDQARWMMSLEENSAKDYWMNTDTSSFPGFNSPIVALNWGGKRDYATWFCPDPNAMLGIQLIPDGPLRHLSGRFPSRVAGIGRLHRPDQIEHRRGHRIQGVRRAIRRIHGAVPGAGRSGRRPCATEFLPSDDRQRHHQVLRAGLGAEQDLGRNLILPTGLARDLGSVTPCPARGCRCRVGASRKWPGAAFAFR